MLREFTFIETKYKDVFHFSEKWDDPKLSSHQNWIDATVRIETKKDNKPIVNHLIEKSLFDDLQERFEKMYNLERKARKDLSNAHLKLAEISGKYQGLQNKIHNAIRNSPI